MDIWIIAAILAGVVMLGVAYNVFWVIVEAVRPFTYRQVPFGELHDHILAVYRRGLNRSEMHITCEQNGKHLRFRKTYKYGTPGVGFHVIVPGLAHDEPGLSATIAAIDALKLPHSVDRGNRKITLDVDCLDNVEKANAAADAIVESIVRSSSPPTFSVRVKGGFFGVDGYIGGETRPGEIAAMYRRAADLGEEAKPYKWAPYFLGGGTLARSLGAAIGRIAAWLFPPRR